MITVQISDKGQITLPAAMRRKLGLGPKSRVDIRVRDGEIVIRPVRSISELSGILQEYAKGRTSDWNAIREEVTRAVAEEVLDEHHG